MVRRNKKRSPKKQAYRENTVGCRRSTSTEVISGESGTADNNNAPPKLANSSTDSASSINACEDGDTVALPYVEFPKSTEKETQVVEPATTDVKPEKEKRIVSRANKQNSTAFFDVIGRLAQLVKSEKGTRLLGILEKVVALAEDEEDGKRNAMYEVMGLLLEHLEDSSTAYVGYLLECLKSVALSKTLRKLYVEKDVVKDGHILLGNGGFGEVYRGYLDKPGAPSVAVAIKETKHERLNGMFVEEAEVMAQLDHRNVLKILAITKDEDITKIVLEFMEEKDLFSAIMADNLHFGPADLLKAIHDVTCGMEYLEGKQFVHRDLKCQNVLVDIEKRCKIGDFGLCKYVGKSDGVYEERGMNISGTHVAPETKNTNRFTSKSDVWAMGMLIWELYSVNRTWCESKDIFIIIFTMEQILKFHLHSGRLPQVDGCPVELHDYVAREILNRDPMNRPNFVDLRKKVENIMKKI